MTRIRTKDDGLGEIKHGDVLKIPTLMMDQTTIDANRKAYFADAGWHKPGFRTSVVRNAARDSINDAYAEYEKAATDAWRSPEAYLAEAKSSAAESDPRNGRADPDDPKSKKYRRKQTKAPFVERAPDDTGGEPRDGVRPMCKGTGHDPDDGDDADARVRATESGVEGIIRQDVPDAATVKQTAYDAYENELENAWRK